MDFEALYQSVLEDRHRFNLDETVTLLRQTSEEAIAYFEQHVMGKAQTEVSEESITAENGDAFIDMLHIDGNHDYAYVSKDAALYIPLVRQGGIIVFDDINWESVRRVYDEEKKKHIVLFENGEFGILLQDSKLHQAMMESEYPPLCCADYRLLQMMLPALMENVAWAEQMSKNDQPVRVFAGVMTYNSAAFIEECLRSIMMQKGNIELEIGVFDDCSTDLTIQTVRSMTDIPENVHLTIYANTRNEGYEKNYIRVFRAFEKSGCAFLTCVDGDDYLCSPYRVVRHIEEMQRHPECAVTFNRLLMYFEDSGKFSTWDYQDQLKKERYTAFDLADYYFIGNGSCSMIRRNAAIGLPDSLFLEAKIGDWMTHCVYAQRGDICYINEIMNVYRRHSGGVWSGCSDGTRKAILRNSLRTFNKVTQYLFYQQIYKNLTDFIQIVSPQKQDLIIMDDVFPHPVSGFRMEEYCAYLNRFQSMQIFCNGGSTIALGTTSHPEIMAAFKQMHPELADRLIEAEHIYVKPFPPEMNLNAKLLYFCFLGNVYPVIELIEKSNAPFVFELYPGGSFKLNQMTSDQMLLRVLRSPCFRKVIVTQDVTRDYLLDNGFCRADQIVEIFGVVTPRRILEIHPQITSGQNGSALKVCFAAMRYTPDGRDKGYDVFVDVIKMLAREHRNIEFHVAGKFDESVIPLDGFEKYVTFHGVLKNTELSEMMKEMDIIVSPNSNDAISPGAFDGFPTATCTEAGLCGTLIMCTDPLGLNNGRFKNEEEIEIVQRDAKKIAERILYYDSNRDRLRKVIHNQYERIQQLYAAEIQVDGRIRVLEEEIDRYEKNLEEIKGSSKCIAKRGRLFWSDKIDSFRMEDVIEFDYKIGIDGQMTCDIPLGDLEISEAYVWIYFINESCSICRINAIQYAGGNLEILQSSQTRIGKSYFFEDVAPYLYLGRVERIDKKHKFLHMEADVRLVTEEQMKKEMLYEKNRCLTGAILHAETVETLDPTDTIAFDYRIKEDGTFSFTVDLDECPMSNGKLWVYFVANHRCACRFDAIEVNGMSVEIANTNGVRKENGEYQFDTFEPFFYLDNINLYGTHNCLTVEGKIQLLDVNQAADS